MATILAADTGPREPFAENAPVQSARRGSLAVHHGWERPVLGVERTAHPQAPASTTPPSAASGRRPRQCRERARRRSRRKNRVVTAAKPPTGHPTARRDGFGQKGHARSGASGIGAGWDAGRSASIHGHVVDILGEHGLGPAGQVDQGQVARRRESLPVEQRQGARVTKRHQVAGAGEGARGAGVGVDQVDVLAILIDGPRAHQQAAVVGLPMAGGHRAVGLSACKGAVGSSEEPT